MRLHAIVDDLETARIAADGGATVIQLRLKNVSTDDRVERGRPFRELCDVTGLTFVVNDDVDAAIELRADGVHLGRDDEGVELAIRTQLLLGRSAATPEEAVEASGQVPSGRRRARRTPSRRSGWTVSRKSAAPFRFRSSRSAGSTPRTPAHASTQAPRA